MEQIDNLPIFIVQEQRDAYAVIRGFVYQVNRTMSAWLDLDDNTFIYCECGEDIDYVQQHLLEQSFEEERLVEQVKHRDKKLSLRSKEILEAIANYINHKKNNPKYRIKFRFFTNTLPAREKGVTFPRGLSGLEAWEQIREGNYNKSETKAATSYIRRTIIDSVSAVSNGYKQIIRDFLTSIDEEILVDDLISHIEWALGKQDAQDMQPLIEDKIIRLNYAAECSEVQAIYYRLFACVFHLLSLSGEKRLDKEKLIKIISDGILGTDDQKLLEGIQARLARSEAEIRAISVEVATLRAGQNTIAKEMAEGFQDVMSLLRHPEPVVYQQ